MTNRKAPMPGGAASGTPIALPEVNDLLDGIADAARVSFGAESISIARVDEAAGELDYLVASGRGAKQVIGMRLPLGRGLAGYCAAAAATLAIDDVTSDPRFARDVAERIGYVPRSMLVAPVLRGDEVLGVLSVLDRTQPAGAAALDLAGRFARACEGALTLAAAVHGSAATADTTDAPGTDRIAAALAEARALGSVEADAAARLLDDFLAYATSRRDAGRTPE
jgi:GAF domain-containing protein